MNNKSISLAIIAKNAEKTIEKTITTVSSFVDEIILVDTGSIDTTVEIAKKNSAKIFYHTWTNNFAEAKNIALDNCSSDWILNLDSDEFMAIEDLKSIRAEINNPENGAFTFIQTSDIEGGREALVSCMRLYRNLKNFRYRFAIHETLDVGILDELNLKVKKTKLPIYHSGYATKEILKRKEKRNLKIAKEYLLRNKLTDEIDYFHYAVCYMRSNSFNSAPNSQDNTIGLNLIKKRKEFIIKNSRLSDIDLFMFYSFIPEFLLKYNLFEYEEELFNEAFTLFFDSPYIFFKIAEYYYFVGNYNKSKYLLNKCLEFGKKNNYNPELLIDSGILNTLTFDALKKIESR